MNKIYLLPLIIVLLFSCTQKKTVTKIQFTRTGQVKCVGYDQDIIKLISTASASTVAEGSKFAERNAMENLLFKGIPNSNQETPFIANELESLGSNKRFYELFLIQRDYEKFIIESSVSNKSNNLHAYLIDQYIEIDLQGMRKHLENRKVIKKFGL